MSTQVEHKGFLKRHTAEVVDFVKNKLPQINRENAEKSRELHHIQALMSSEHWPSFEKRLLEKKQDAQDRLNSASPVGDGALKIVDAQREIKDINDILHFGDE